MNIATRLVLLVTLCSITILTVALLLDYRVSRAVILERLEEQSQETVKAAVSDLENLLDSLRSSVLLLGRVLSAHDYSQEELRQLTRDLVEQNPDIYGATIALNPEIAPNPELEEPPIGFAPYFYRRDGNLREVDLALGVANYSGEDWYQDTVAAGEPIWTEPYFDSYGARILMTTFTVPAYRTTTDGEKVLYAVATADLALDELQGYLQRLQLGDHGHSMLLSRSGTIISDRYPHNVLKHHSELGNNPEIAATFNALLDNALAGNPGSAVIPCDDMPGDCTLQMGTLKSTGWPVMVFHAQGDMLAPLHRYLLRTLLIGLACAAVGALILALVSRRLTNPLSALAQASDRIARGELDTALPPTQGTDEVSRLVRSFQAMTGDLKTYITDLETATASRGRLEGELAAARAIQMSMLPGQGKALEQTNEYSLCATVLPARSVGGDLYSYNQQASKLVLAVGDVSDKGVPAALFMAKAISHLQQAYREAHPADAVARLNNQLTEGNDNCMFVTLFLGVLDLQTLQLTFCSAGHPAPQLVRNGRSLGLEQATGPALGLAEEQLFPCNRFQMQAGDRLVVFSDGVDEAFNSDGEMFTESRLSQQLDLSCALSAAAATETVLSAIDTFSAGAPQSDDITLLLLDIRPGERPPPCLRQQHFAADKAPVADVLHWLETTLSKLAIAGELRRELALVSEEIVSNIDKYAGLQPDEKIQVSVEIQDNTLQLQISDPGRPFNPLEEASRATMGEASSAAEIGGLGVHLIIEYSDDQHYARNAGYNHLRISRDLSGRYGERITLPPASNNARPTPMDLTTTVTTDPAHSMARVHLAGGLNTDTAPAFEDRLTTVLAEGHALTVLDMRDLDYISSAGLRVIFKASKQARAADQRLAAANRKPHIDKVFEILKALPDMAVFATDQELDDYLASMQSQVRDQT